MIAPRAYIGAGPAVRAAACWTADRVLAACRSLHLLCRSSAMRGVGSRRGSSRATGFSLSDLIGHPRFQEPERRRSGGVVCAALLSGVSPCFDASAGLLSPVPDDDLGAVLRVPWQRVRRRASFPLRVTS